MYRIVFLTGCLATLMIFSGQVQAQTEGKVIKVADGDTLTILKDKREIRVRLTQIDAPEKKQAYGTKSRQSLAELCFGKNAVLTETSTDRYGRTLAQVTCDGIDANRAQLGAGMAWVYDRYVHDRSLYELQRRAKAEKRGLWYDQNPVPPWEFRKSKKMNGGINDIQ